MVIAKNARNGSNGAQARKTEYSRVAPAALIMTLALLLFVFLPQAAALESGDRGADEQARFSTQAAAIEYYLEIAERGRGDPASVSFSSQAEAIDFYLAELRSSREGVVSVAFSSQTEAIDFYLAKLECDRAEVAEVSFSSQAAAIDYYLGMAQGGLLSVAGDALSAAGC